MGLFFRKNIKAGPLRVNLTKSGIGVSGGVKGAKISKGPCGTDPFEGRATVVAYVPQKVWSTRSLSVGGSAYGAKAG